MRYPVKIEKIEGEYVASIAHPDGVFQGACAGNTKEKVKQETRKLLAEMVASAMRAGEEIPAPQTCTKGNDFVVLPPLIAAKAAVYNEMRKTGRKKADIARALQVNQKQVDRILDPSHRSTLLQLDAAAMSMGKYLEIRLS